MFTMQTYKELRNLTVLVKNEFLLVLVVFRVVRSP